jgi:hypothetical protein
MTVAAKTCWILVHPKGEVDWASMRFREERPPVIPWIKWRWQRWILRPDEHDQPFGHEQ